MLRPKAPAWSSEFDGTAIKLAAEKWSLQNALKSNLRPVPGFEDFAEGTRSLDLQFLGFISRRPDVKQRRRATKASIALFENDQIRNKPFTLAGTLRPWDNHEGLKALAVAKAALGRKAFGFIDDKPHRIGAELVSVMTEINKDPSRDGVRIILGAVAQEHTEYRDELWRTFDAASQADDSNETYYDDHRGSLYIGRSALHVVTIDEFSIDEGVRFADTVLSRSQDSV